MNQDKLLKAFEKAKGQKLQSPSNAIANAAESEASEVPQSISVEAALKKQAESARASASVQTKPIHKFEEKQVLKTSVISTQRALSNTADLSKLVTHSPMSVASMKKNKLIYAGMKNQAVLNAYRELRIKLMQKSEGGNTTILVSSVAKKVESTLTAMNLAISYSLDRETSALVIDCNPYSDELRKLVTSDYDLGLTDYVDDPSIGIDKIIYQTGIDRVGFIPSGSNNERAVELFSSSSMEALLYELKNRYQDRNIIVNTPPVLKTSEARVLTEYCDLTVLTVPFAKASNSDVEDAVNAIGSEHIAGVIYQH